MIQETMHKYYYFLCRLTPLQIMNIQAGCIDIFLAVPGYHSSLIIYVTYR